MALDRYHQRRMTKRPPGLSWAIAGLACAGLAASCNAIFGLEDVRGLPTDGGTGGVVVGTGGGGGTGGAVGAGGVPGAGGVSGVGGTRATAGTSGSAGGSAG